MRAARDDLTFALFVPWDDEQCFANRIIPQVKMLENRGMQFADPMNSEGLWTKGSWENVPALIADVALVTMQRRDPYQDLPLFQQIHAVKAARVYERDDKRPYAYNNYAECRKQLAQTIEASEGSA